MLLSFMGGPEGRQHYGTRIQGIALPLRFERIQRRHYGMKLMAYTMINVRRFCGI
jgi:hypothetical protein